MPLHVETGLELVMGIGPFVIQKSEVTVGKVNKCLAQAEVHISRMVDVALHHVGLLLEAGSLAEH